MHGPDDEHPTIRESRLGYADRLKWKRDGVDSFGQYITLCGVDDYAKQVALLSIAVTAGANLDAIYLGRIACSVDRDVAANTMFLEVLMLGARLQRKGLL